MKSLRGVTVHLDALVRKGYIERTRQARSIRIIGETSHSAPLLMPVVGRIAAGQPILAEQNIQERLAVDPRWVPGPGCFALCVHGESMVGAGIMDGDYVVVRPQPMAENGQIVAVLIDGEATVKRFYRELKGGRIRLQAENPAIEPMFIDPRRRSVQILGKVVGLFRKL